MEINHLFWGYSLPVLLSSNGFLLPWLYNKLSFEESKDFHNLLLILDVYVSKNLLLRCQNIRPMSIFLMQYVQFEISSKVWRRGYTEYILICFLILTSCSIFFSSKCINYLIFRHTVLLVIIDYSWVESSSVNWVLAWYLYAEKETLYLFKWNEYWIFILVKYFLAQLYYTSVYNKFSFI